MYKMKDGRPFEIRKVQVEDAQALIDYINLVAGESDNLTFGDGEFGMTLESEISFLKTYETNDNGAMFLALLDGEIISCMSYGGGKRIRTRHAGEFGISVKKKYWNRGIAHHMLKVLIGWAEASPYCEKMNLRVREDNTKAIQLYEKFGFVKEGLLLKEMKIDGKYINCYFMGRDIKCV